VERSAETTRDDPGGEYLKRNRWFESGSLQQRVSCELCKAAVLPIEETEGSNPFPSSSESATKLASCIVAVPRTGGALSNTSRRSTLPRNGETPLSRRKAGVDLKKVFSCGGTEGSNPTCSSAEPVTNCSGW
jgi:hypothetical protein